MMTNPFRTADKSSDATDAALRRMLACRDHVRRWFSSDATLDPDVPEVIGARESATPGGGSRPR
jgi:hypothetical protein